MGYHGATGERYCASYRIQKSLSEEHFDLKIKKKGVSTLASTKDYLNYILDQLSELEEITYYAMMGEFIIYYRGKIVGGIYDNRLLVKPVSAAKEFMPDAPFELPYEGAKEMLLVENVDDKHFLAQLFEKMYSELPAPKPKKKKK